MAGRRVVISRPGRTATEPNDPSVTSEGELSAARARHRGKRTAKSCASTFTQALIVGVDRSR